MTIRALHGRRAFGYMHRPAKLTVPPPPYNRWHESESGGDDEADGKASELPFVPEE